METVLKLQLYFFCLLVILVLWIAVGRRRRSVKDTDSGLYRALLASSGAMCLLDSLTWIVDGAPGPGGRLLVMAAEGAYYAAHTLPIGFFFLYAHFQLFKDESRLRRASAPLVAAEALVVAMAVVSFWRPCLFGLDAGNRYFRGPLFPAFAAIQYGLVGLIVVMAARRRKSINTRVLFTLLAYPLPALIASIGQMVFYGLTLIWPMTTVFLVIAFCNIENGRAKIDYLTGTANRRCLDEELELRIAAARSGKPLCGILIDVDDFKKINDTCGHEEGDRTLEGISSLLLGAVRSDDLVARMGGDEFVVLADLATESDLESLVARIEGALAAYNRAQGRPFAVSLSIGRSLYLRGSGETASRFLAALDADMYARKNARKSAS